jgi:hypothetical protein
MFLAAPGRLGVFAAKTTRTLIMLSLRGRLKHSTSGTEIDRRRLGDRWEINIAPDLGRKSKLVIEASRDRATRAGACIAHVCNECRDTISAINTEHRTYIFCALGGHFTFPLSTGPLWTV